MLEQLWEIMNSPIAIVVVASIILMVLNRLYAAKPLWRQFEGSIIAAVKLAEKAIPDNTPNKSLARLDSALDYVVKVFGEVRKRPPNDSEKAALREGIQITHSGLEKAGQLRE